MANEPDDAVQMDPILGSDEQMSQANMENMAGDTNQMDTCGALDAQISESMPEVVEPPVGSATSVLASEEQAPKTEVPSTAAPSSSISKQAEEERERLGTSWFDEPEPCHIRVARGE